MGADDELPSVTINALSGRGDPIAWSLSAPPEHVAIIIDHAAGADVGRTVSNLCSALWAVR